MGDLFNVEIIYHYSHEGEKKTDKVSGENLYKPIGRSVTTAPFQKGIVDDPKFETFISWLRDNGAEFSHVEMCSMGGSMRGVYLKDDVERGTVIVKIPKKLIMSCDMGINCELSQGLQPGIDSFEKLKHIYFANFLLEDMETGESFFKPYYDTLPEDISNIPVIWTNKEINRLHGSYFSICIRSRVVEIYRDYQKMCDVNPMFCRFSFDQYLRIRLLIGSRNFGSYFNNYNNGILVPLADMLNHSRPRQSSWEYRSDEEGFVITSLMHLPAGSQVMDSYGRRDNRRFFFSYGFVEDDNLDGNLCSPDTVAIAILPRRYETLEAAEKADDCVKASPEEQLLNEEEDCGIFWNSIILDVMEKVDNGEERELTYMIPEVPVSSTATTFGAELSRRSQWIYSHSSVFATNILNFDGDLHYDHSDARYVYLSMSHDDAGTTTKIMIPSFHLRLLLMTHEAFVKIQELYEATRASDLFQCVRGALTIDNEFYVLETLAAISRVRLASYDKGYNEHVAILKDESVPMFSNERNTIALLRSEQQVLLHYILLFEIVKGLIERPVKEQVEIIEGLLDRQHSIYDYLQIVWLPLLDQVANRDEVYAVKSNPYSEEMKRYLCRLNLRGSLSLDAILEE